MRGVFEIRIDDEFAKVDLKGELVTAIKMFCWRWGAYTRLDGDDTASGQLSSHAQVSEQLILVGKVGVATSIVGVHAKVVTQTVRKESSACASLEDLILVALQNTCLEQTVDGNLVGQHVDVVPENTFLEDVYAGLLHLENRFVNVARLFGEFARERECSCLRLLERFCIEGSAPTISAA